MAVTVTTVFAGPTSFVADIKATADGDTTTGNIAHGLGAAPVEVALTNLVQAAAGASLWAATTIDGTNIVCTKSAAAGSGNAANQVRLIARLPHSLTR